MIASKSVNSQIKCSWETVERHLAVGKLESKRAGKNVLSSTGPPLFKNRTWSKAQSAPPPRHNNPTVWTFYLLYVHIVFTFYLQYLQFWENCLSSFAVFLFVTQDDRYLRQIKHWNSKMRGTQYRNWYLTNSISVQYMKNANLNIKADNNCFLS